MKRFVPALALLAACAAAPLPAPPPPAPAPVPQAPTPPEVASVELGKDGVVARDAGGRELFRTTFVERPTSAVPVPGGGVVTASRHEVVRLDEHGKDRWRAAARGDGKPLVGAGLVMIEQHDRVALFDLEDGSDRGAIVVEDDALVREGRAPEPGFRVPLRLFPGSPEQRPERALAMGVDGTLLVGAADGSLVGLDARGVPRFQTGVRGAVREIEALPDGDFLVETPSGEVVVGPSGVKSEPLPRGGATLAFQVRPSLLQDPARGEIRPLSVVFVRPDDVWALVSGKDNSRVLHHDGKSWREVPVPDLHPLDPRCWVAFEPAARARCNALRVGWDEVTASSLARSPDGRILLLGVRRSPMPFAPGWASNELRVWESTGGAFRPHRELARAFDKAHGELGGAPGMPPMHAASAGGQELVCLNGDCLARGLSPSFHPAPAPAGAPPWAHFSWGDADWLQTVAIAFAGPSLWRADGWHLYRDGEAVQPLRSGGYRALWASGEDAVWLLAGSDRGDGTLLVRWDGKDFTEIPSPVPDASSIWGTGPDDVWLSSSSSAAHFDGHTFATLPGVSGSVVGIGREEAWIGAWHVSRDPSAQPDLAGAPAPLPPPAAPSLPLPVSAGDPTIRLDPASIDGFRGALGLAAGPSGQVWIHDGTRVAELDGASVRLLHTSPGATPLRCGRCLAPTGAGSGLLLAPGESGVVSLVPVISGRAAPALTRATDLLAVARSSTGSVWAVGASADEAAPRALVHGPAGLRLLAGLPSAAYADVAARTDDDVWLAGGLSRYHDGTRAWPEGEGVLVHFDGRAFTRFRAPDGALLAVAAVAPGEAWAVGVGGSLLHVRGSTVEAFHLVRGSGQPLVQALRAVAAGGPDDVWIAGDAATLLHWDGRALQRADTRAVAGDAGLSALIAPGKSPGWLAGQAGVWRVSRGVR